jgi:hypothetical protein
MFRFRGLVGYLPCTPHFSVCFPLSKGPFSIEHHTHEHTHTHTHTLRDTEILRCRVPLSNKTQTQLHQNLQMGTYSIQHVGTMLKQPSLEWRDKAMCTYLLHRGSQFGRLLYSIIV